MMRIDPPTPSVPTEHTDSPETHSDIICLINFLHSCSIEIKRLSVFLAHFLRAVRLKSAFRTGSDGQLGRRKYFLGWDDSWQSYLADEWEKFLLSRWRKQMRTFDWRTEENVSAESRTIHWRKMVRLFAEVFSFNRLSVSLSLSRPLTLMESTKWNFH